MKKVFKGEKMEKELITIIIPVYNVEKYIHKCIDSVINQTYKNLEIILIDDGSKDNCSIICDDYAQKDKRIKVIHKKNEGVSSARNVGLNNAAGDWVTFIDADDWIEKDFCTKLMQNKAPNIDCLMCGYNRIINDKKIEIKSVVKQVKKYDDSRQYLINSLNPQTGYGFCHMKIIKRDSINKIRFNEQLNVAEDALFNMELSEKITKILFINDRLYNYRLNINSVVKKYDPNYVNKYLKAMETCKKFIFNKYNDDIEIMQNYYNFVAYHVLLIAVNYCYNPKNKYKRKSLIDTVKISIFKEGIKNSNYENISYSRKIALFMLKHKLYYITGIICIIRQKTTNKR